MTAGGGDIGQLREQFPHWSLGAAWTGSTSGPGLRNLFAIKDDVTLTAPSAEILAEKIAQKEGDGHG